MTTNPKVALVLGGGAPNLTLMAGALAALDAKGVEFEVLSTSGAGMLVGMLYAAPKGKTRQEALKETLELGVHDSIYQAFPINYKVFHKVGTAAEAYNKALAKAMTAMKLPSFGNDDVGHFWKDAMTFWASAFSPTDPRMWSRYGLCQPAPWIEEVVDFDKLRNAENYTPEEAFQKEVLLNAYCIEDRDMVMFDKKELTPDHFRAALAFPLIYEPFRLNGKTYIEGSAIDPLNFEGLVNEEKGTFKEEFKGITDLIVLDVLGREELIAEPRDLYDSWVKSMIVPLVSVAEKNMKMFRRLYNAPVIKRDALENPIIINRADGKRLVLEEGTSDLFAIDDDDEGKIKKGESGEQVVRDAWKVDIDVKSKKMSCAKETRKIAIDGYIGKLTEVDKNGEITGFTIDGKKTMVDDIIYKIVRPKQRRYLHRIGFDIEASYWPNVLDWSRSNLKKLFDIGYDSASKFADSKDKQYLLTAKKKQKS